MMREAALVLALAMFAIGMSVGQTREQRRDAAFWGQITSDSVVRSTKGNRG